MKNYIKYYGDDDLKELVLGENLIKNEVEITERVEDGFNRYKMNELMVDHNKDKVKAVEAIYLNDISGIDELGGFAFSGYKFGLKELVLPERVERVNSFPHIFYLDVPSNNHLMHLNIPEGVTNVKCERNNIQELELPKSIEYISCDNSVNISNLDEILRINPELVVEMMGENALIRSW